jgi:hypothetical protein
MVILRFAADDTGFENLDCGSSACSVKRAHSDCTDSEACGLQEFPTFHRLLT